MDNDNENTHAAVHQYLPMDGKTIYNALMAKGFKIWKVGKMYYLWIDNQPINVETTYSLNRKLYALGILPEDKALIGPPHAKFMKLCRKHSERFALHVKKEATPLQDKEYKKAKKTSVSLKVFFRKWMLNNYQPKNHTMNDKHQEN